MKKYLSLVFFLFAIESHAADVDISAFPAIGEPAAVTDGIVTYDSSAAAGSRATVKLFDNTATNYLNGTGGWSVPAGDDLGSTAYSDVVALWTTCTGYLKSDGTCDTPSTGATNFNDIGDATAAGSIALAGYMQTITSTLNSAGASITMTNTTADLTADVSFIDFKYTDTADANGYFLRGYDGVTNLKWYIGAGGTFYGAGFESLAADGEHYYSAVNTVAITAAATAGRGAYYNGYHYIADGTDWNDYLMSKERMDTPAELETVGGLGAFFSDYADDADASTMRTTLGLVIGTDVAAPSHTVQYSQTPTIADPDTWSMSGNGMYGGQWIGSAAGIGALPAIAAGMNFTAKARGAYAVTLEPNGTELIWLNGVSCGAGVNIVSSGVTGATAVCLYSAAGVWDCDGYLFACGS